MTQHPLDGILDILKEALEGGDPEAGTAFVENTRADGVRHGLLPTLERLSAPQASREIHGASIAGHARHSALHLEVLVRWERDGERGPFDWKGSFLPMQVGAEGRSGRRCSSGSGRPTPRCWPMPKPCAKSPPTAT
ncbi:MAG: hypothetical protein Q4C89_11665 [Deinococcus sp.]|uniref:hypothetical protein n=1 Tax=Deinococcus sp. TaxID=47478 RepID=UPI0026DBD8E8|nr:hypothetical protein [Deinococcus sp.]MDO4246671.1 hypothetical protein [Deinococcus sp.]